VTSSNNKTHLKCNKFYDTQCSLFNDFQDIIPYSHLPKHACYSINVLLQVCPDIKITDIQNPTRMKVMCILELFFEQLTEAEKLVCLLSAVHLRKNSYIGYFLSIKHNISCKS
jgi:hypothetical protein